jgi:hypothetical protein
VLEAEAFIAWTLDEDGAFIRAQGFLPSERAQALCAAGLDEPG